MESLEDFEMNFYNGIKISKSSFDGIKILDDHGKIIASNNLLNDKISDENIKILYEHFEDCIKHCLLINKVLTELPNNNNEKCFPIIIGRRPDIIQLQQKRKLVDSTNNNNALSNNNDLVPKFSTQVN